MSDDSFVIAWQEVMMLSDNHVDIALRHFGPPRTYIALMQMMDALGALFPNQ